MPTPILKPAAALRSAGLLLSIFLLCTSTVFTQSTPEPEREMLLNGLRILYLRQPGNPNVVLRLRIHSGAAFDLANKGGMMALLSDAMFPDPSTRDYVTDELGGRLEVTTTHDAIDVTISGNASGLERMIDLLRGAVLTTQLDAASVTTLRNARVKLLSAKAVTAADVADHAITNRLFGTFPYAHPASGTAESVAKVERADLMLARERFLNADNATLAVIGGVEKPRLMRALRQLLGPWEKSDKTIPSTFRQPNPPDARALALAVPGGGNSEVRIAVRGLARQDTDALAADLLAMIVRERLKAAIPQLTSLAVKHESHLLPGMFLISLSTPNEVATKALAAAQEVTRALSQSGPTPTEVESARSLLTAETGRQFSQPETVAAAWLDVETFKSPRPSVVSTLIRSLSPADVQRVATRLFKDTAAATVVVATYNPAFGDKPAPQGAASPDAKPDPAAPIKKP